MIRLSSEEFPPPLHFWPILKRFGLFFFLTPLRTHDLKLLYKANRRTQKKRFGPLGVFIIIDAEPRLLRLFFTSLLDVFGV